MTAESLNTLDTNTHALRPDIAPTTMHVCSLLEFGTTAIVQKQQHLRELVRVSCLMRNAMMV
jgi:hypothetical protein